MSTVLLPFPAQRPLAEAMASAMMAAADAPGAVRIGRLDWRRFPDGESLVAIDEQLAGADVAIVASLHDPDVMALALRFAGETAREFGARSVGLVAPYLAYMRQDIRFHPGEAVSAPLFARFVSQSFDWLVTVDPHLHRIHALEDVYTIPTRNVAAAQAIAEWIRREVSSPVLIGPDSESEQWVSAIATLADAPHQVLEKQRLGDREVRVSLPDAASAQGRTPVVVDDIVSSGRTLMETLGHLQRLGLPPATCIATHAIFAGDAFAQLQAAGAARVASTDTIAHPSNAISVAGLLAEATLKMLPGC
ncbi:phosphoribosylpyrophosphate synthetase [Lysobacter daejeonensis GH1-9]|uniref:Phosphoribosylpyrophosphate synthetase n=1 Tax=Lysobacter daejeonensis GH1-9 TaxID=1385517 RepID=A0A0A0F1U6_9GAMM|nr:ribose-phosphate diphosphokinase [Lysobacter daejeonensis]KGM56288.1 phosphoribosylpyrophosphate synthetase [Lysobacter daejeonensis GH1-9]